MIQYRACPICHSFGAESLCSIDLCNIFGEFLPNSFRVLACYKCGFCFDDMDATQADFNQYYSNCEKYQVEGAKGSGGLSPLDVQRYESILSFCQPYLLRDATILDVGVGKGGLLRYLLQKGFLNLCGVEPSKLTIDEGSISLFRSISELKKNQRKFDFIFCTQILEHVYDLAAFLDDIKSLLSDSGLCYIEVPDAEFYPLSYIAPFHLFDREHINHFTSVTLNNLFVSHGFIKFQERKFNYVYENIGCIFGKKLSINKIEYDHEGIAGIKKYVRISEKNDNLHLLCSVSSPVLLWGLGAYLRRVILKDDFPKNIVAIIDRDRGGKGLFWNDIPIVTAQILSSPEFSDATVIITAVLYAEEIKKQIAALNFSGTVLTAF